MLTTLSDDTRLTEKLTLDYKDQSSTPTVLLETDGRPANIPAQVVRNQVPALQLVSVDTLGERVLVFEEKPGITESMQLYDASKKGTCQADLPHEAAKYEFKHKQYWANPSPLVVLVRDRDKYWADHFLKWKASDTRKYNSK